MKFSNTRLLLSTLAMCLLAFQFCKPAQAVSSPPGYSFDKPVQYVLKKHLHEISGLALYKLSPDTVYAIDDAFSYATFGDRYHR